MQNEALREKGDAVNELVGDLVSLVRGRSEEERLDLQAVDERAVYEGASDFFEREFGATVEIRPEEESESERAENAIPLRPAIHIE
jgi:leucyl-tRNA synthetase